MPLKYVENWTENAELTRRPKTLPILTDEGKVEDWTVFFYQPHLQVDSFLRVQIEVMSTRPQKDGSAPMPFLTPKIAWGDGRVLHVSLWQPTWAQGEPTLLRVDGHITKA
jgi:hypothetical protein